MKYRLNKVLKEIVNKFVGLSEKWHELLREKEMLSQKRFAESDEETIKVFENNFVANLKDFKYTSISNIGVIEISRDNYMPVIDKCRYAEGMTMYDTTR